VAGGNGWGTSASKAMHCCVFCWVEAAQAAARCNQDWRQRYWHLAMRREKSIAKVALGRQLAVWLYWMWRNGCVYSQSVGVRFARGTAGYRTWCEVKRRALDWASRSLVRESSNK
jgi:hypothetical protein